MDPIDPEFGQASNLKIDNILEFLPSHLKEENSLIYVNELGNKKKFLAVSAIVNEEYSDGSGTYTAQQIDISLIEQDAPYPFTLALTGSAGYDGDIPGWSLHAFVYQFLTQEKTWLSLIFTESGEITTFGAAKYDGTITLLGREFNDVYSKVGADNEGQAYNSFSEIMINSDIGIVAFRDRENELWVFDSVE